MCDSVCPSVCLAGYPAGWVTLKGEWISMKFVGYVGQGSKKNWLNFVGDPIMIDMWILYH